MARRAKLRLKTVQLGLVFNNICCDAKHDFITCYTSSPVTPPPLMTTQHQADFIQCITELNTHLPKVSSEHNIFITWMACTWVQPCLSCFTRHTVASSGTTKCVVPLPDGARAPDAGHRASSYPLPGPRTAVQGAAPWLHLALASTQSSPA